ncbi:hypothetical protein AB6802_24805 [Mesorhizobium sp. RCC_202]|uniref:hypothetical protein n=1 Tax=Mesorhizobium sp. RCC_202 TaxID=3239222 RepID=UPI003523DC99
MQRIKTFRTVTRAVAAACFLMVQVVICIGTVYWAVAATLRMEGTPAMVLGVVFAVPSAYFLMVVCRMAYEAETDPANQ